MYMSIYKYTCIHIVYMYRFRVCILYSFSYCVLAFRHPRNLSPTVRPKSSDNWSTTNSWAGEFAPDRSLPCSLLACSILAWHWVPPKSLQRCVALLKTLLASLSSPACSLTRRGTSVAARSTAPVSHRCSSLLLVFGRFSAPFQHLARVSSSAADPAFSCGYLETWVRALCGCTCLL